jgi:hypothetical protein
MKYIKPKLFSIQHHAELNEQWLQDQIAADPSILGLGEVVVKDRERRQPRAGRLDLLLQDSEMRRYEVELQLGKTDESHIIRTIEYWDIERRRFPQYDHCAVIVAEDVTSRFLNIISLFNGHIPIIAIQVKAFEINDGVGLIFTKIIDELSLGLAAEDEEEKDVADRHFWETKQGTKSTVAMADEMHKLCAGFSPDLALKYNRHYIGHAQNGRTNNFVIYKPKKKHLTVEIRLNYSVEIQSEIESTGIDVLEYSQRNRRFRLRLSKATIRTHSDFLTSLMQRSYLENG